MFMYKIISTPSRWDLLQGQTSPASPTYCFFHLAFKQFPVTCLYFWFGRGTFREKFLVQVDSTITQPDL